MIERHLAPDHLFEIAELDFSSDLFAAPLNDPWFRLGLWSSRRQLVADRVEEIFERQSLLIPFGSFPTLYDRLGPIGNTLSNMGEPTLSVLHDGATEECQYNAFHNFSLPFTSISAEPLVFFHARASASDLFVSPDLWLYRRAATEFARVVGPEAGARGASTHDARR